MNKHSFIARTTHTQPASRTCNQRKERKGKTKTTTEAKVYMLLSPTPPPFKKDHNSDKGRPYREKGNQEMRFAGKRKDTNPITCENPPPTNKGGTSDTAHVEEG